MATTLASNRAARDATLARVKKALGKSGDRAAARADAERYMAARTQGPRPAMPADLVDKFLQRATDVSPPRIRTVDRRMTMPMTITAASATSFCFHHGRVSFTSYA